VYKTVDFYKMLLYSFNSVLRNLSSIKNDVLIIENVFLRLNPSDTITPTRYTVCRFGKNTQVGLQVIIKALKVLGHLTIVDLTILHKTEYIVL